MSTIFGGEDLNVPLGFRFYPTNKELIFFLQRKVNGEPLPPNKIIEANVYEFNPQILIEKYKHVWEKEWYFFSPRMKKYMNGMRPNRAAGDGYWKATGSESSIMERGREIGLKQSLVFYVGKSPSGIKTNWIMHEFRLSQTPSRPSTTSDPMMLDEHVLYKIYNKTGQNKNEEDEGGVEDDVHNELLEVMNGNEPTALEGGDVIGDDNSIAVNLANQSSNGQFWSYNSHQPSTYGQNFYDQFNTSYDIGDAATRIYNDESIINSTNQTTNGQFQSHTHDPVSTFYNFGDFSRQGVQEYNDSMTMDSANQIVDGLLQGYYGDHQSHFHDQSGHSIDELFQSNYIDYQIHIHDQTSHISEM